MQNRLRPTLASLVLLILATGLVDSVSAARPAARNDTCTSAPLHVASPDWRDQIIYFAMIDRFDNADSRNDDQGAEEFDPTDGRRYSGGDLAGLSRRLDYIHDLGATALWITPPVANQWWDARHQYGGYHGYWAEDFMRVDAHAGTLDDYRKLSRCLHARDMFLIQDIVVNHVGNFFRYDGAIDADDPEHGFHINTDAKPHDAPTRYPFSLNDVRRKKDRAAAIYHWTPDIIDFADTHQLQNWQLAGLDDLNTENPLVRKALRQSYAFWIDKVGVDGYRIDTAFYVPPEFFDDFLRNKDRKAPGILDVAARNGQRNFLLFGEGFAMDAPYKDESARKIDRFLRDENGKSRLPGMLNFPLYGSTLDVFARGKPTAILAHRIDSMQRVHANPHLMPSFVDNHDVDRFLAGGSEDGLKQALLLIMTLPGIPVIYYGTEQGFSEPRASMFATGFGSGGRDHFDRDAPLYRYVQRTTGLRRNHQLLSRGTPTVLASNAASAGVLAYRYGDGDETLLVVFNSSDEPTLLAALDTGLPPGTALQSLFSIDGEGANAVLDSEGTLTLRLPARSGQVWKVGAAPRNFSGGTAPITIESLPEGELTGDLELKGSAHGTDQLRIVIDGRLASSTVVAVDSGGRWRATIDTSGFIDPSISHEVLAWSEDSSTTSRVQKFRVRRDWHELVDVEDPVDDDRGLLGTYRYPTDPLWQTARPLDLRGVRVSASGNSLRIALHMHQLVAAWNPPNGFDHLAPTIYIELPNRKDGARVMPLQNSSLPGDMRWHLRLRAGGWSNTLTRAESASAANEGIAQTPAADLHVDRAHNTIEFTLSAAALGYPATLSGTRILVTTWDYDGGYRALKTEPGSAHFGGGDGDHDALIMDQSAVIRVP